ncbi:MAG: DNA replication/repair protein RecF [Bacillota bacterium]
MKLLKLRLTNFRNFSNLEIYPYNGINIINGRNAQGKTNLLESIFMALTGYSFRTSRLKETINLNSSLGYAHIDLEFERLNTIYQVRVTLTIDSQKRVIVNGKEVKRDLYPFRPNVVLFIPDDLALIKGGPRERRQLLDTELGIIDPTYNYYLQQYQRVLSQRNNLLRLIRERKHNLESLEPWNNQLYNFGSQVVLKRLELLSKFFIPFKDLYHFISGNNENIQLRYLCSLPIGSNIKISTIINCFKKESIKRINEELIRGQTLLGPHRDDIIFLINNNNAKQFGSQGQIRSIVIAIKLTLLELWKRESGISPVLLLDDILTELDSVRQEYLLKLITDIPTTLITSSRNRNGCFKGQFLLQNGTIDKGVT